MTAGLTNLNSAAWTWLARCASRPYLAGAALEDALRVCRRVAKRRVATSLSYWNRPAEEPPAIAEQCLAAIDAIARQRLDCYLSVKAPPLGFNDGRLAGIIRHGEHAGVRVHFDAHGPETADAVFGILSELRPGRLPLGCTLPGRWERSLRDADTVVRLRLEARVVKGQWVDPKHPELDPRQGFLAVVNRLAGRVRHVRIATHDPALARKAIGLLRAAKTSCELELLLGLPTNGPCRVALEERVPMRLYVPYGTGCLPYTAAQVRERPHLIWRLVRDLVFGRASVVLNRRCLG